MKTITTEQFREVLRARTRLDGSQKATARKFRIPESYLSDILRGNREPSESVAKLLGYERGVVFWRR